MSIRTLDASAEAAMAEMEKKAAEQSKQAQEAAEQKAIEDAAAQRAKEEAERYGTNKLLVIGGDLVIHGAQLVPSKLLAVMYKLWEQADKPFISAINITKGQLMIGGNPNCGSFDPLSCGLALGLEQIYEDCTVEDCVGRMAMDASVWFTTIMVFAHELAHANGIGDDEECDTMAIDWITTVAQKFEIEVPDLNDMGWLGGKLNEFYAAIEGNNSPMYKLQRELRSEGIVFMFEGGTRVGTMRNWVRYYNTARTSEEAWAETAQPLVKTVAPAEVTIPSTESVPYVGSPDVVNQMISDMATADFEIPGLEDMADGLDLPGDVVDVPGIPGNTNPAIADIPGGVSTSASPKPWELPSKLSPKPLSDGAKANAVVAIHTLMKTAFAHIFAGCKWSAGAFQDADYVSRTEIDITSIPFITELLVGVDTVMSGKKTTDVVLPGKIRGFRGARAKLPQYTFHLNDGAAVTKFDIIPQNPQKDSATGKLAAAGHMIAWITRAGDYKYKVTCPTGQIRSLDDIIIEPLKK